MKQSRFSFDGKDYILNYIQDAREASVLGKRLGESPTRNFGLDIETRRLSEHPSAGLDPHLSSIRLVQLYDGANTVYTFDISETTLGFLEYLRGKNFVAHYGCFEIKHLAHAGLRDLSIGCSMIQAMILDCAERSEFEPEDEEEDL